MECKMAGIRTFCLVLIIFFSVNAAYCACAKKNEDVMTGAACSISELNKIQNPAKEKNESMKNLRRKVHQKTFKMDENTCFWGHCLIKQVLYK